MSSHSSAPRGGSSNRTGGSAKAGAKKAGNWGGSAKQSSATPQYKYSTAATPSTGIAPTAKTSHASQPKGGQRGGRGGRGHSSHQVQPHGVVLPPASEQYPLIDIGANLCHRDFQADLPALIKRSQEANVSPIIVTGTSVRASEQAVQLCASYPGVLYSTAGVHPHDAKSCTDKTIARLRELATAKGSSVLAIGECGLDFDRNFSEPAVQEKWFAEQLKLAGELKLPVFLHERSAFKRFVEILEENKDHVELSTCVVHCFTGNAAELKKYLSMGMYIGITGWVTNLDKGKDLRAAVKSIPLDRIMIETDAPFLAPRNGKDESGGRVRVNRNEPELLHLVLQELADCMGVTPQALAEASTANARRFFRVPTTTTTADAAASSSAPQEKASSSASTAAAASSSAPKP